MDDSIPPKSDRTEMWKALKWTAILLVLLMIAFGAFKTWQAVTAPARAVEEAAGSVKTGALAVMNRLDIPIDNQRRFDKAAEMAFVRLNTLTERAPDGVKDRGFRMTNLRGAQNRICELSYDFGNGAVPVFLAADNAGHEAAQAVASKADRLMRIVIVSAEQTVGLNVEYGERADQWGLGWRPSSVKKIHPDAWAENPITEILRRVPKDCAA